MAVVRHKEAIHSGHFMISEFETEDTEAAIDQAKKVDKKYNIVDISLKQLFQRMSIAYRHKLTSPKWNHFKGLKLRWKDKIRLNNVIWRCWHMQFIKGKNKLLCAFANPLEIDHDHNMMESGALLEGKYWKRKARTITSEYQRWRLFHRHHSQFELENDEDCQNYHNSNNAEGSNYCDDIEIDPTLIDSDLFVDDLFNTLENANHSFAVPFPNPRDMYKSTTNADFIQPGLIQLQPNLEEINIGDLEWLNPTTPPPNHYPTNLTANQSYSSHTSSKGAFKKEIHCEPPMYSVDTPKAHQPPLPSEFQHSVPLSMSFPHHQSHFQPSNIHNINNDQTFHSNYNDMNTVSIPSQKDLMKKSPKQRFLYRDHSVRTEDCSCRPTPYPHSRTRSWSTSQINFTSSSSGEFNTETNSELIALLKNKSTERHHLPLLLKIPPPPPHAAPQPAEDFEQLSDKRSLENSHRRLSTQVETEIKRRGTVKNGFDVLRSLIPSLNGNSNLKISKAALLNKGGEYLQKLKQDRGLLETEIQGLRSKIQLLNSDIAGFQSELPSVQSTGPDCIGQMNAFFSAHVKNCSQRNWKYWIFSLLMRPLLESFETSVGTGTFEDLCRTSLSWLDQHCSMRFLRSSCLKSLTYLSTSTDILNHPDRLPQTSLLAAMDLNHLKNELENNSRSSNNNNNTVKNELQSS
ncbi:MLX-interacting protein [Lepeophtheirus salmonis]|uniref:MLX-interacting protein n=1 Tax=Lepeophtheirus salmonis TaxID=72036 RepID=UPI001AE7D83C|nr:carbohydrate-responsive element-binding protein-like [Lepeophtheirus salmonis]